MFSAPPSLRHPTGVVQKCIAVAGATGYIGGRLVPRLLADGHWVRCLVRSPRKLADREWAAHPNVEVFPSRMEEAADLAGCDIAYYLVHSMMSARGEYAERDRQLAMQFGTAARHAGVQQIVLPGWTRRNRAEPQPASVLTA